MTTETSIYEYAKNGLSFGADRTAIWYYGKRISYHELFEKIDNTADHLYQRGVREGTVVTIHLPNCPQAVMAIYAVAKLGGICNIVHALMPLETLRENMVFTESDFLITHFSLSENNTVCLNSFTELESRCEEKAFIPKQNDLAQKCVLYLHSSGTTGNAKTVMHYHAAMNRIVEHTFEFLHCKDFTEQVVLAELPLFHGFGLIDNLHDVIAGGGQLVQMARWDSRLAAEWIDQYHITFMAGVPKFYYDLLAEPGLGGQSLTHCYVGGDTVDPALKRMFNERLGRKSLLYEGFGMAEVIAYCCSCGPYDDRLDSSGRAMPGTRLALLCENHVSFSGEGELLVASDVMMLGYYHSDENCFFVHDSEKWFRTGDYVRIDENGYVYYIERIKNIIIRNGYDVFPTEIETLAKTINGVSEACVIGADDGYTQKVVSFIEGIDDSFLRDSVYRTWRDKLFPYAIPAELIFVDRIPRNPTGKVDRAAVKRMYGKAE